MCPPNSCLRNSTNLSKTKKVIYMKKILDPETWVPWHHLHIAVHLTHSSIVVRSYHRKKCYPDFESFISSLKNSFRWEPIFILKRLKSIVWTIVWKLYKWFVAVSLQHWINCSETTYIVKLNRILDSFPVKYLSTPN